MKHRIAAAFALIALIVAIVLALPASADVPFTPFPSFFGSGSGSGGGGGGSGTVTGTGASPQVAFWTSATAITGDAGLTYTAASDSLNWPALGATAAILPSTCTDNGGTFNCLKLNGGTDTTIGLATGNYLDLVDAALVVTWTNNTATQNALSLARETADGRGTFDFYLYPSSEGGLIQGTFNAGATDGPAIVMAGDTAVLDNVVHVGAIGARAAASADPLLCASTTLATASSATAVPKSCAFADGTWQSGSGTAAKPTYSYLTAGGTDDGMYLAAANNLGFTVAGTQTVEMIATGLRTTAATSNVSIGTASIDTTWTVDGLRASGFAFSRMKTTDSTNASGYRASNDVNLTLDFQMRGSAAGLGIATASEAFVVASSGINYQAWDFATPHHRFYTTTGADPSIGNLGFSVEATEVVINNNGLSTVDARFESDTKTDSFFLDASAETTRLNGGSTNGGCDISAAGALTCAGAVSGSGSISGSGANTQVTFWTAASTVSGDAGMTYNSATDTLTVGGTTISSASVTGSATTFNFLNGGSDGLNITSDVVAVVFGTNSNVTMSDTGTGSFVMTLDGVPRMTFDASSNAFTNGAAVYTFDKGVRSANHIESTESVSTCAAGVVTINPTSDYVALDANGAACVVTLGESNAVPTEILTIEIYTSAGAGVVTFPNSAGVHAGPTLCTTTGLTENGVYTLAYSGQDTMWKGVACTQN